jgi:hypothetical protein
MTIKDRVLNTIKARRERVIKGEINCIPLPFERFRTEWPGVEQGMYYLISGASKSSKTQLANYLFVYNTVLFAFKHRDIVSPKIYYYNLEETDEAITLRFMSFLLYTIDKIRVSPTDLKSTDSNKPVHEDIISLLESPKYKEILDFYEEVVEFKQSRNPTGVYKDVKAYAEEHGVTHKKKYTYKDELGITKEGEGFDYYTPNNPNEYFFIIVDHVSLLETERGLTLRESINKLSEYLIIFRNRYNYIPVVIQQQGLDTISLEAFKNNKIRPTLSGLSDSKSTGKDCNMMIGITNPYSFELPEYLGYQTSILKGNFRVLEIVLNRNGQANGLCPLFFDGAINYYKEMPLPNENTKLQFFYERAKAFRNSKTTNKVVLFVYSIINNLTKHNE